MRLFTKKSGFGKWLNRRRNRTGATLFEYTLIVAIVSIAAVLVLISIGKTTNNSMTPVLNALR